MQPNKRSSRPTLVVAGLAVIAALVGWLLLKQAPAPSPAPNTASPQEQTVSNPAPTQSASSEDTELRPQSAAERAHMAPPPVIVQPVSRPAPSAPVAAPAPAPALPEPSAYTRQLVSGLTNLDFSRGSVTKEQAEQWKQSFQTLTNQGAAAVPAIREFLAQNQEMNFGAIPGGGQLGEGSLRSALINALGQIGGPEANAVMLQTLQSTTLPSEIAQLAQIFEQQAPGQYRQETMNAINEVLAMAGKGQLPNTDVGPLFKAMQNFGDPASASMLEQLQSDWKYYSTMSMAGLQNGTGVSGLVREVQDPAATGRRDFAYQMLAQVAGQYNDAGAALLDQARAGQIPDSAWSKIATGLAGDQYEIGAPPPGIQSGLKTYHIQSGNQNFYSLPLGPGDQATQNLQLINQLLAVTSSPVGRQALQNAQASLSGMASK